MQSARVLGTATSTLKHPSLAGWKMLLVQPTLTDGKPDGFPFLVVDAIGAGIGEQVLISSDGATVKTLLKNDKTPVRWMTIGIVDE